MTNRFSAKIVYFVRRPPPRVLACLLQVVVVLVVLGRRLQRGCVSG